MGFLELTDTHGKVFLEQTSECLQIGNLEGTGNGLSKLARDG
jgi:hypothetical protein